MPISCTLFLFDPQPTPRATSVPAPELTHTLPDSLWVSLQTTIIPYYCLIMGLNVCRCATLCRSPRGDRPRWDHTQETRDHGAWIHSLLQWVPSSGSICCCTAVKVLSACVNTAMPGALSVRNDWCSCCVIVRQNSSPLHFLQLLDFPFYACFRLFFSWRWIGTTWGAQQESHSDYQQSERQTYRSVKHTASCLRETITCSLDGYQH